MAEQVQWQLAEVTSPHLSEPVPVVAAKNIPYMENANRLQNLSIYLPSTLETLKLVGRTTSSLPDSNTTSSVPRCHVHIHGGAWRDPYLNSTSIETDVAHAFSSKDSPIDTIVSINYTLSPFPTHPNIPYDPAQGDHEDPAREAQHPMHIHDVLSAFELLRSFGLTDSSFILSGHSCGACLAFQSVLASPGHWYYKGSAVPRPAALLGMNGLYDLPALVHGLGSSHEHLRDVYEDLIGIAFGKDEDHWPAASPALLDAEDIGKLVSDNQAPRLVVIDQSTEDQLVPMNEAERMQAKLEQVRGLHVVRGHRCVGVHAAPWEQGYMIWENINDILALLKEQA